MTSALQFGERAGSAPFPTGQDRETTWAVTGSGAFATEALAGSPAGTSVAVDTGGRGWCQAHRRSGVLPFSGPSSTLFAPGQAALMVDP